MDLGSCMLCVPVTATSVETMCGEMQEAARQGCDIIELRLDLLASASRGPSLSPGQQTRDLDTLLLCRPRGPSLPIIVTCRAAWEGGNYGGTEDDRLALLQHAVELGAEYVDIELKAAPQFLPRLKSRGGDRAGTRIILSHHRFEPGPVSGEELGNIVARMHHLGADVAKFALMPEDIAENATAFQVLGRSPLPTVALLMGERGLLSRVLAPKFGAFLTFAALDAGRESAPGQPPVRQLIERFHFRRLGPGTRVFGVVGNPVAQSKSPVLHNAALRHCGLDAVYVPLLVDDLRSFLEAFNAPDFAGFSVTIPHKLAALACAHHVEPLAQSIGAVNTLIRGPDGALRGYNTDCYAAMDAIEDGLRAAGARSPVSPLQGRVVVVIGAGGAGRALAFGAKERGATVVVANRSAAKASELASVVGGTAMPLQLLQEDCAALGAFLEAAAGDGHREGQGAGAAVLANSTSVGMHPHVDASPASQGALSHFALVFDAVYNPRRTKLLADAEAAGAASVSGLEMFVGQAAKQFELFTGLPAPVELMRQEVLASM